MGIHLLAVDVWLVSTSWLLDFLGGKTTSNFRVSISLLSLLFICPFLLSVFHMLKFLRIYLGSLTPSSMLLLSSSREWFFNFRFSVPNFLFGSSFVVSPLRSHSLNNFKCVFLYLVEHSYKDCFQVFVWKCQHLGHLRSHMCCLFFTGVRLYFHSLCMSKSFGLYHGQGDYYAACALVLLKSSGDFCSF